MGIWKLSSLNVTSKMITAAEKFEFAKEPQVQKTITVHLMHSPLRYCNIH